MDMLHTAAGVGLTDEQSEELTELLVTTALGFLRAGGVLSLQEYSLLSDTSRMAFQIAADSLRIEQAARLGKAVQGTFGVAAMLAEIDGGDTLAELACKQMTERTAAKLAGARKTGGGR